MQLRFVDEFIRDGSSVTAAAKRAGYAPASATEAGSRLMSDPRIQAMLDEASEIAVRGLGITKEKVLQQLWLIATSNPIDAISYDENGEPQIDLKTVGKDKAGVTEVAITTSNDAKKGKSKTITIKTPKQSDKVQALIKIGQNLGMFKDQVEVNVNKSLEQLIAESMEVEDQPPPSGAYETTEDATPVEPVEPSTPAE